MHHLTNTQPIRKNSPGLYFCFLFCQTKQSQYKLLILDYSTCGLQLHCCLYSYDNEWRAKEVRGGKLSDSTFTALPGHTAPSQGKHLIRLLTALASVRVCVYVRESIYTGKASPLTYLILVNSEGWWRECSCRRRYLLERGRGSAQCMCVSYGRCAICVPPGLIIYNMERASSSSSDDHSNIKDGLQYSEHTRPSCRW